MSNPAAKPKHAPSTKLALDDVLKSLQDLIRNDLPEITAPEPDTVGYAPVPPSNADTPRTTPKDLILELEAGLADLSLPPSPPETKPASTTAASAPMEPPAIVPPLPDPVSEAAKTAAPAAKEADAPKTKTPRPPSPQLAALLADLAAFDLSPAPEPAATPATTPVAGKAPPTKPAATIDKMAVEAKTGRSEKQKHAVPKALAQPSTPLSLDLASTRTDLAPVDSAPIPARAPITTVSSETSAITSKPFELEKKQPAALNTSAIPAPPPLRSQHPAPRVAVKENEGRAQPSPDPIKQTKQGADPAAWVTPPPATPAATSAMLRIPDIAPGTVPTAEPLTAQRAEFPLDESVADIDLDALDDAALTPEPTTSQKVEFPPYAPAADIDLDGQDTGGTGLQHAPAASPVSEFLQDEPATDTHLDTLEGVTFTHDPATGQGSEYLQEAPAAATELDTLDGVRLDFSDHGGSFAIERDQSLGTPPTPPPPRRASPGTHRNSACPGWKRPWRRPSPPWMPPAPTHRAACSRNCH